MFRLGKKLIPEYMREKLGFVDHFKTMSIDVIKMNERQADSYNAEPAGTIGSLRKVDNNHHVNQHQDAPKPKRESLENERIADAIALPPCENSPTTSKRVYHHQRQQQDHQKLSNFGANDSAGLDESSRSPATNTDGDGANKQQQQQQSQTLSTDGEAQKSKNISMEVLGATHGGDPRSFQDMHAYYVPDESMGDFQHCHCGCVIKSHHFSGRNSAPERPEFYASCRDGAYSDARLRNENSNFDLRDDECMDRLAADDRCKLRYSYSARERLPIETRGRYVDEELHFSRQKRTRSLNRHFGNGDMFCGRRFNSTPHHDSEAFFSSNGRVSCSNVMQQRPQQKHCSLDNLAINRTYSEELNGSIRRPKYDCGYQSSGYENPSWIPSALDSTYRRSGVTKKKPARSSKPAFSTPSFREPDISLGKLRQTESDSDYRKKALTTSNRRRMGGRYQSMEERRQCVEALVRFEEKFKTFVKSRNRDDVGLTISEHSHLSWLRQAGICNDELFEAVAKLVFKKEAGAKTVITVHGYKIVLAEMAKLLHIDYYSMLVRLSEYVQSMEN